MERQSRHVDHIIDIEALVDAAMQAGDKDKAINILLDAVIINNENLERCAAKLNETIEMLNLQQKVLEAILGADVATKH